MPFSNICSKSGQSLIELLIAVTAISVVLITIAAAATRSLNAQNFARAESQATKLAEEQIEKIRIYRDREGFSSLICAANCYIDVKNIITSGQFTANGFTVWLTISDGGSCPTPGAGLSTLKEITATTQWGFAPATHQVTTSTCLSDWRN